jgi:hypothetical protein
MFFLAGLLVTIIGNPVIPLYKKTDLTHDSWRNIAISLIVDVRQVSLFSEDLQSRCPTGGNPNVERSQRPRTLVTPLLSHKNLVC